MSVSRVLLSTVIYLGYPLPDTSSHLRSGRADRYAPYAVLLRIGFTKLSRLRDIGELLPRRFILTLAGGLFSVALSLRLPSADVIRYPCPMKPGLSSAYTLSYTGRDCPTCIFYILIQTFSFFKIENVKGLQYNIILESICVKELSPCRLLKIG